MDYTRKLPVDDYRGIINYYRDYIEDINKYVPSDHLITIDDFSRIVKNHDALESILYYFMLTYYDYETEINENGTNFRCMDLLVKYTDYIIADLLSSKDVIIIAPGDSPSKIIGFMKLIFKIPENIKIISFPASALIDIYQGATSANLDIVIKNIITHYNFNKNDNYIFFDYQIRGSSLNVISKSFRKNFNDNKWKFNKLVNIKDINDKFGSDRCSYIFNSLIESSRERCVRKLKLGTGKDIPESKLNPLDIYINDLTRCNIFIIMMALNYLDITDPLIKEYNLKRLIQEPDNYEQLKKKAMNNIYAEIEYYNTETLKFETANGIYFKNEVWLINENDTLEKKVFNYEKIYLNNVTIARIKQLRNSKYKPNNLPIENGDYAIIRYFTGYRADDPVYNLEGSVEVNNKYLTITTIDDKKYDLLYPFIERIEKIIIPVAPVNIEDINNKYMNTQSIISYYDVKSEEIINIEAIIVELASYDNSLRIYIPSKNKESSIPLTVISAITVLKEPYYILQGHKKPSDINCENCKVMFTQMGSDGEYHDQIKDAQSFKWLGNVYRLSTKPDYQSTPIIPVEYFYIYPVNILNIEK